MGAAACGASRDGPSAAESSLAALSPAEASFSKPCRCSPAASCGLSTAGRSVEAADAIRVAQSWSHSPRSLRALCFTGRPAAAHLPPHRGVSGLSLVAENTHDRPHSCTQEFIRRPMNLNGHRNRTRATDRRCVSAAPRGRRRWLLSLIATMPTYRDPQSHFLTCQHHPFLVTSSF